MAVVVEAHVGRETAIGTGDVGPPRSACGRAGHQPLRVAASGDHKHVVESLLDNGADVNAANNNGWTPFLLAARAGHGELVELLLARGADANAKNRDGKTP